MFWLRRNPAPASRTGRKIPIQAGCSQPLEDERRHKPYISNAIKTSKYNVLDFLPRQLLYQFSRLANAYMLVISILQAIPGFSTTGKFTTLIPLVIFLGLVIAKEGYYDWKRHRQDVVENKRQAVVLRDANDLSKGSGTLAEQLCEDDNSIGMEWTHTSWKDLRVGDIIRLSRDEDVPADVIILHADGEIGLTYVETMALDGETSLKPKQRPTGLPDCSTIGSIAACEATLHIEDPNADLYRFDSKFTVDGATLPLTLDQVIYRGSTIRNTPRTIGIVINTGEECKIRMNSKRETRPKKPALESITNNIVIFLMMYVLISSSAATVAYVVWKGAQEQFAWYLSDTTIPFADIFVGFIIMFNNVIPLSLYVGLEAIKLGQMSLIGGDLEMYHVQTDAPAGVNTTNNLDDLGQISYIFSDKTGTLTENIMKLRMISIAGTSWLHTDDKDNEGAATTSNLTTKDMLEYIRSRPNTPFAAKALRYVLAMSLCHTCLPDRAEDGEVDFQASSPDELALVRGARDLGFIVTHRSSQSITVQIPHQDGTSSSTVYEILDVVEFSSKRKRMSVIVRCPDGRIWLICKGADNIMLPRLRMAPTDMKGIRNDTGVASQPGLKSATGWTSVRPQQTSGMDEAIEESNSSVYSRTSLPTSDSWIPLRTRHMRAGRPSNNSPEDQRRNSFLESDCVTDEAHVIRECFTHIDQYATEGLRTLVYADKFLDAHDYANWKRLYREAETSLDGRQDRIEEVSELLEQHLDMVGASAVEDKLQDGVPETIEKMRQAGIKVWMLTGDKRETAINIAHSTRLCGPETAIHVLDVQGGDLELQITNITDSFQYRVEAVYSDSSRSHTAIVVDGETLTAIESPSAERPRRLFADLVTNVDSVICCRASPAQKALLVNMIRKGPKAERDSSFFSFSWLKPRAKRPITLAIGDGANDLAMISAANVGVGISGREGQQAARVADFSISQFRFLSRLVLVHGRWNYHRTTRFILATFWKETFIFFPQALFQSQTGATGTSLYDPQSLVFVSFFTAATILIIGTWEQDLKARTLMVIPELFRYGQNGEGLTARVYLRWFGNALVAGLIVYAVCWFGYSGSELIDDAGLYAQGLLTFIVCVIWINIKLL